MSGKITPDFGTLAGKNVLELIFSFVVWKWEMTTPKTELRGK